MSPTGAANQLDLFEEGQDSTGGLGHAVTGRQGLEGLSQDGTAPLQPVLADESGWVGWEVEVTLPSLQQKRRLDSP
jgi:hypothetical protein